MNDTEPKCLVCERNQNQIPLISLSFGNETYWICPSHLPTLIHNPQELIGRLPGAENLTPHER